MVAIWKSSARSGALLCALVLGSTVLGACGNESGGEQASDSSSSESTTESTGESPSETPTESEAPAEPATDPSNGLPVCEDVWVDGLDLPKDYTACSQDGEAVKPVKKMCGFGSPMIIHDDRFYALRGNRVNDVGDIATSEQFQSALAACQA
ncbi:hypothetical protein [Nocardioides sp. Soil805]|uniref:hypothetical protein n=1 Tax=Nocardioides sp. Soil805 TaxID=1736416 RepID=UPI00070395AF|nr:hypothetical protein [Nocardioides sp. Soil805]KRF30239.1 hypothetical protein ASG94_19705 [Nocardioides sp. Soil805]